MFSFQSLHVGLLCELREFLPKYRIIMWPVQFVSYWNLAIQFAGQRKVETEPTFVD